MNDTSILVLSFVLGYLVAGAVEWRRGENA